MVRPSLITVQRKSPIPRSACGCIHICKTQADSLSLYSKELNSQARAGIPTSEDKARHFDVLLTFFREGKRPAEYMEEPGTVKKQRIGEAGAAEDVMDQDEFVEIPASTSAPVAEPDQIEKGEAEPLENAGDTSFRESPYTYLSPDDPYVVACLEKLNINSSFPAQNLLVRNPSGEAARSMYITNDLVRKVIENNDYTKVRLVTAGTKIFGRQEGKIAGSSFRVLGDGIPVVMPYIADEHIVTADIEVLRVLMEGYYPLLSAFDQEFRKTLETKSPGNHIVRFPAGNWDGVK
jgi:multisite-specific tRNA:(cytosine-C5)-methyltransferase